MGFRERSSNIELMFEVRKRRTLLGIGEDFQQRKKSSNRIVLGVLAED